MASSPSSHGKMNAGESSALHHNKGKGVTRRGKGIATQDQLQAHEATKFFKDHMSLIACKAIERVDKELLEKVKEMPIEEVHQEVEYRVMDPSSMFNRSLPYDLMIMIYV